MLPSDDICYRAIASRDKRFDGRFVVGVQTTGIYCRPGCPARTPKRGNVRFFQLAAVAESEGFRPCLRCRPSAHLLNSAWVGSPRVIGRAMRLIAEGGLDGFSVAEFAERLGVGERHLRRLFDTHVGAPPLAIAQSRRLHFARNLVESTRIPLIDVAMAAGYPSVRRFNHAFRAIFCATPTDLRNGARDDASMPDGAVTLRLSYRPPIAWRELLAFLRMRAIPGVEEVEDDVYRRSFVLDADDAKGACEGILEARLSESNGTITLTLPATGPRAIGEAAMRARRLFDLGAEPTSIERDLRRDPIFAPSLSKVRGLRVPGAWDPFELAVRAVLGQQVTVKGARTLASRLVIAFGKKLAAPSQQITHIFPVPRAIANASLDAVAAIGLPRTRAESLRAMARAIDKRELDFDSPSARDALLALPGIGPWTADYIAMRLGDPDSFPAADLVLCRALADGEKIPSAREVEPRAAAWSPWRSYAAIRLWHQEGSKRS
jgi:AraC family transcriptional regulator of adaptative response / DNA-3-methyladenine glycosylase II